MAVLPNLKKSILFVDDEASLLELYPLAFEGEKERWNIQIAPGGIQALSIMERGTVDVLVSDMRMPGMDGARLLQEVVRLHPRTSRLIISGFADAEQIAQCLGATHQFMAKPCNLSTLRGTIERVCGLDSLLMDGNLKTLVSQFRTLPSLPSLYFRINQAVSSPDTALEEVGKIISSDPGMTAKILQLGNSAFFGIARQIANPSEAVQYLGIERVRALVLSLHVFSCFEKAQLKGFSIDQALNHCMSTGVVAKLIARMQKVDRTVADEACTAGMLHDIGKVMLAASLPDQYEQAVKLAAEQKVSISDAECEIFGANHSQVGAYLLGLWGLPVTIVEAVAFHHEPQQSASKAFSPLTAVHIANALVREDRSRNGAHADLPIDTGYLAKLGIENRMDAWREATEATLTGAR